MAKNPCRFCEYDFKWRGFFLPFYFVNSLHFNIAFAGLIASSYGLGTASGGLIGGLLADRYSPEIIANTNLAIKALVFVILIKLISFWPLVFALYVLGFTTYNFRTCNNYLILGQCRESENERL